MKLKPLIRLLLSVCAVSLSASVLSGQLLIKSYSFSGIAYTDPGGFAIELSGAALFYDTGYVQLGILNTSGTGEGYITSAYILRPEAGVTIDPSFSLALNQPLMPAPGFGPTGAEADWNAVSSAHPEMNPLPGGNGLSAYIGFEKKTPPPPPHENAIAPNTFGVFGFTLAHATINPNDWSFYDTASNGPDIMLRIQTAGEVGGDGEESSKVGYLFIDFDDTTIPVPEPALIGLFALALPLFLVWRRRMRPAAAK